MTKPPRPRETEALIDRIYAAARDPAALDTLRHAWEAEGALDAFGPLAAHASAAEAMLAAGAPAAFEGFAWFALSPQNRVEAFNAAAVQLFGVYRGMAAAELPFAAGESDAVSAAARGARRDAALVRVHAGAKHQPMVLRVSRAGGLVHAAASAPVWPASLDDELFRLFGLSRAEADVLRALAEGLSVQDIAEARERRVLTIRTQIRSILRKTGATDQSGLIRFVLGVAALIRMPGPSPAAPVPRVNAWRSLGLADGRRLDYLLLGAGAGAPLLWLPSAVGVYRFTPRMEADLAAAGLTLIVPARAGFGASSPAPPARNPFETSADDFAALLDHLDIAAAPVASLGQDFCAAAHFAARHRTRVSSIIACAPVMPAFEPRHFARMHTWQRFIGANARHAPAALPFLVKAGFAMAQRAGKRRFAQALFGNAPADAAALADPEVMDTLVLGSEPVLSEGRNAAAAFAAETRALNTDWSALLARLEPPVTLFAGHDDAEAPIATVLEYAALHPRFTLVGLEGHGRLAAFTAWPKLLALLKEAAVRR